MLRTSALRDLGTSGSRISTQDFHKTKLGQLQMIKLNYHNVSFNPLFSSYSWSIAPSITLAELERCYIGRSVLKLIHAISYACLLAILKWVTSFKELPQETGIPLLPTIVESLQVLRKKPQPISASCMWFPIHLWSDVLNELPVHCLLDWLCSLCYCIGSCSVCSHQFLIGQPTNKKSVSILPPALTPFLLLKK